MLKSTVREDLGGQIEARPKTLGEHVGFMVGMGIGKLLRASVRGVFRWRLTFLYVVIGLWLAQYSWWGPVLAVVLLVGPLLDERSRPYAVVVADLARRRKRVAEERALRMGNQVLRQMGLAPSMDEETVFPVEWVETELGGQMTLLSAIPGLSPHKFVERCKEYRSQFNAVRVKVDDLGDGSVRVLFVSNDPLDEAHTISSPSAIDLDSMSVPVGVDADGETFSFRFKNNSGLLLGGIPGGGKSAAASTFCLPLALAHEDVEMCVIDGKGGDDWSSYDGVVSRFIPVGDDFNEAADFLDECVAEMKARVASNLELFGVSSFWEASPEARRSAGRRFKVIVFDECQFAFDMSGLSKDEKAVRERIQAACVNLVKLGRSAGMFVVFITQKPTADALPTAIRSSVNLRASLRMVDREAEKAVLGEVPDDLDVPRAVEIPAMRPGGAVVVDEMGSRKAIRFYYFPERDLRAFLDGARRRPTGGVSLVKDGE